jgi:hypothetical protein
MFPNAVRWCIAILRFFFTIIIIILPHIFVRSISRRCLDQTLWNLVGISYAMWSCAGSQWCFPFNSPGKWPVWAFAITWCLSLVCFFTFHTSNFFLRNTEQETKLAVMFPMSSCTSILSLVLIRHKQSSHWPFARWVKMKTSLANFLCQIYCFCSVSYYYYSLSSLSLLFLNLLKTSSQEPKKGLGWNLVHMFLLMLLASVGT